MDEVRVTHGRRGKAHKEHFSGAKGKNSTECAGSSKHRTNKVPPGTNSVWCDPLNMPSTSTTPTYSESLRLDEPLSCSSNPACDLSTNLERLSLNTITDSVNGLVNGSLDTTNECKNEENSNTSDKKCTVKEPEISSMLPSIKYVQYESELQMPSIMKIIQKDLSEPYSIYTYRYFIHNWPKLCFLAMCGDECVGAIVCKLDVHRKTVSRGYIAMLAVDQNYRKQSIGSTLVKRAIQEMVLGGADEVVLETEVTNKPALRLYEALGFVRDKRLFRYYLNGVDALRLKLWLR